MLNILLSDKLYREWLLEIIDELELMFDYFTSVAEVAEEEEWSLHKLEKVVGRAYQGGVAQAALDSIPA